MKTVGKICTDVSAQLNDQATGREFTRWTRALLLSYLNGALTEISSYKPDAFTASVSIPLVAGAKQQLPQDHLRLLSLDTNSNGSGITQADAELMNAFSPYTCCAGEVVFDRNGNVVYTAKSYAIDQRNPKVFYVDPPVPVGVTTATVNGTTYAEPPQYTELEWGTPVNIESKYLENILDYMQARAHDIDMESPMAKRNAQDFFRRFYQAMGVKYRVESAHRAGNVNGAVGDGDPRARIA